jgi:hypothetical protein
LRRAGRWDDAIAAKREAIDAGYRSEPDPEADIAECLLLAGRRAEADALFAALRERDPEDVWLYNAAAFAYAGSDARASLEWSRAGIEVALRTGDPDGVAMQLLECADAVWDTLGDPTDEDLVERVEVFVKRGFRASAVGGGTMWSRSKIGCAGIAAMTPNALGPIEMDSPGAAAVERSRSASPNDLHALTPCSAVQNFGRCSVSLNCPSGGSLPRSGSRRSNGGRICSTSSQSTASTTATPSRHASSASMRLPPVVRCTSAR